MIGALLSMIPWSKNASDKADTYLNATVSSRAAQTTADAINGKVDVVLSTRASQTDVTTIKTNTDVKTSTRASSADIGTLLGRIPSDNTTKMGRLDLAISAISPINQIIHGLADDISPTSGTALSIEGSYTEVAIPAVNVNKSIVIVHGFLATISGVPEHIMPRVRFVDSTTIRFGVYANATRLFGPFMLVEFK